MPLSPLLKGSEIMEEFSIQGNGFKEKENEQCAIAAFGGSISISLYPLKYTIRV